MPNFRITLSEFMKQIVEEIEENKDDDWQNKPLAFNTEDRHSLHWLSMYESDGVIQMDVGTGDEQDTSTKRRNIMGAIYLQKRIHNPKVKQQYNK